MIESAASICAPKLFPYLPDDLQSRELLRDLAGFFRSTAQARDGRLLDVFEAGDRSHPTVLLINALGMSMLFLAAIARHLATTHHVVTWETRGLPDLSRTDIKDDLTIVRHAEDAADVLAGTGRRAHAIVSYCSGVNIAAYGLAKKMFSASTLCVVSPSIELPTECEKTDYQRTMLPIWRNVAAAGLRHAALIHQLLLESNAMTTEGLDAELHKLHNLPFLTVKGTFLYALMQASCLDQAPLDHLPLLTSRTLVIHCENDDLIHADTARSLSSRIAGCQYVELSDSDHFGIYTSQRLHQLVADFIIDDVAAGCR